MNELQRIQAWYASHCDGDWEHAYGIRIDTLDNPGWVVEIDLRGTELEARAFATISRGDSDADVDWIHCKVESGKFVAHGGAGNLIELLRAFLDWSQT